MSDGAAFTSFSEAVERADRSDIQTLMTQGVDPREADEYLGKQLINCAVRSGDVALVHWLIQGGIDPFEEPSPLLAAARLGHDDIVILLLRLNLDPNVLGENDWAPLHYAAHRGSERIVKALLHRGAEINQTTQEALTPLLLASANAHGAAGCLLVEKGAQVDLAWTDGYTPLMHAARTGSLPLARSLLERGAGVYVDHPENGWTAFMFATANGHLELMELLLSHGADLHASDHQGFTPLFLAINTGNPEILRLLISQRTSLEVRAKDGTPPLSMAILSRQLEIIRVLISGGAPLEMLGADGFSPLQLAASQGQKEVVKLLLDAGADPLIPGPDGRSAREMGEAAGLKSLFVVEELPVGNKTDSLSFPELKSPVSRQLSNFAALDQSGGFDPKATLIGQLPPTRKARQRRTFLRMLLALSIVSALTLAAWFLLDLESSLLGSSAQEPEAQVPAPFLDGGEVVRLSLGQEGEQKRGPQRIQNIRASASSELREGSLYSPAENAIDGQLESWWAEASSGDGLGDWIRLEWAREREIREIRLVPGYMKVRDDRFGDRWPLNNRLAKLHISFSSGAHLLQNLPDRRGWHTISLESPIKASWLKISIQKIHPGQDLNGDRVHDSGLAEIQILADP